MVVWSLNVFVRARASALDHAPLRLGTSALLENSAQLRDLRGAKVPIHGLDSRYQGHTLKCYHHAPRILIEDTQVPADARTVRERASLFF